MTIRTIAGLLTAGGMIFGTALPAQAGWYIGEKHDRHYNSRFLQRPCPPYHGWNRPFYGWSSNYRPYYFTPQSYANTPWNYGPGYQEQLYHTAAPTEGLNSYGVPVTSATAPKPAPVVVPGMSAPTMATPPVEPTPAPYSAPVEQPQPVPEAPKVPQPPNPGLE